MIPPGKEKTLSLAFRDLTSLPDNIQGYQALELDGNKFTEDLKLNLYSEITHVSLTFNNLQEVWPLPPKLVRLDINNNMITKAIGLPPTLQELDFSHNFLQDINGLLSLQFIEYLYLKGNKIKSIAGFSKLKHIVELDLSDNLIEDLKDVLQFQTHPQIQFLNVHGNGAFDQYISHRTRMISLPYIEGITLIKIKENCFCKYPHTFQGSNYLKKAKHKLDGGCELIIQNENEQVKRHPNHNKHLSIDIVEDMSQTSKRQQQENQTKSLSPSPMNIQQQSINPKFFLPQTATNKVGQFKTFQDAFKGNSNGKMNLQLLNKQKQEIKTSKVSYESDFNHQTFLDLKQQNQQLIQGHKKLEQQIQTLIVQHEQTIEELALCKQHIQGMIKLFDPRDYDLGLSLRPYLDVLQAKIFEFKNKQQYEVKDFMKSLITKMGLLYKTLEQNVSDRVGIQNKRLLLIEKQIVRTGDRFKEKSYKRTPQLMQFIPNLRLSMSSKDQPEKQEKQINSARHEKTRSEFNLPSRQAHENLFTMASSKVSEKKRKQNNPQNIMNMMQKMRTVPTEGSVLHD